MKTDLIDLIKTSGSVRKFSSKKISSRLIKLVIEAGVWGPSLFGIQPWHFVVIKDSKRIKRISRLVLQQSVEVSGGLSTLLKISARILNESQVLIAIYIDNRIKESAGKFGGRECMKKGWMAELLASGAAIQNMFLEVNSLGLGCVWLDAPTIQTDRIDSLLKEKKELVSFLAIGYPNQQIRRSHRDYNKIVRML